MPKRPTDQSREVRAERANDQRQRRNFSAEEKLRIITAANACQRGEMGALLRREGIYSSQLGDWRRQYAANGLAGLENGKSGRKPSKDAKDRRIDELSRHVEKLTKDLRIATKVIELQKKAHEILGIALPRIEDACGTCQRQ